MQWLGSSQHGGAGIGMLGNGACVKSMSASGSLFGMRMGPGAQLMAVRHIATSRGLRAEAGSGEGTVAGPDSPAQAGGGAPVSAPLQSDAAASGTGLGTSPDRSGAALMHEASDPSGMPLVPAEVAADVARRHSRMLYMPDELVGVIDDYIKSEFGWLLNGTYLHITYGVTGSMLGL